MPVIQVNAAVSSLLLPWFVTTFKTQQKSCHRIVLLALALFTVGSVCYWGILFFFGKQMLLWIYGGRYMEYSGLLTVAGLLSIPMGVTTVLGTALRAMERPDHVFWCRVAGTLVAVTLGLWLLATRGVAGAVEGGLASSVAGAVALMAIYGRSYYQAQ
ncbi:MAG: hypothetical protein ACREP8_08880 [Candidatus Binatia bacterium]